MIGVFVLVVIGVLLGAEVAVLHVLPGHVLAPRASGAVVVGSHDWPLQEPAWRATYLDPAVWRGDRLAEPAQEPKIHHVA